MVVDRRHHHGWRWTTCTTLQHVWGPFGLALTFNSGFAFSLFSGRAVIITVLLCVGVVVLAWVVAQVRTVPMAVGGGWSWAAPSGT